MVKSKNKKSVIALVVMAFLLVASIVLAATGAWFTASGNANLTDGKLKFGTVALKVEADTGNGVYRADGTTKITDGILVAGDQVKSKFTITNESDTAVYYLVKSGTKFYKVESGKLVELETAAAQEWGTEDELTIDYSFEIETTAEYGDKLIVPGFVAQTITAGAKIDFFGGACKVAMVQKENISAAGALTELQTLLNA